MKVGVLTTHPIQYQVPWFRLLHADPSVDLHVFFCMLPDAEQQGEGFGVAFDWDVPLLDGYRWQQLENVAAEPSLTRFTGCDTPAIGDIVRAGGWDAFIVNGWVVKSCLQTREHSYIGLALRHGPELAATVDYASLAFFFGSCAHFFVRRVFRPQRSRPRSTRSSCKRRSSSPAWSRSATFRGSAGSSLGTLSGSSGFFKPTSSMALSRGPPPVAAQPASSTASKLANGTPTRHRGRRSAGGRTGERMPRLSVRAMR